MICLACEPTKRARWLAPCAVPTPREAQAGEHAPLLRSGQRLADRCDRAPLGVGRLGVTYHVTDLDTGRDVALKMMFSTCSSPSETGFGSRLDGGDPFLSGPCLAAPQRASPTKRWEAS